VGKILRLLERRGLAYDLRSSGRACGGDVFVLDSIGELRSVFPHCRLVVMGGSFSGKHGGHNVIEPALDKRCVLCGPHMENFRSVHRMFLRREAVFPTKKQTLAKDLLWLLENPEKAAKMGGRAFDLVREHRGAARRIVSAVLDTTGEKAQGVGRERIPD
jgi:3-deoxy-D-manno-octulosonic-acid transferase